VGARAETRTRCRPSGRRSASGRERGTGEGSRTPNDWIWRPALCQLSYTRTMWCRREPARPPGGLTAAPAWGWSPGRELNPHAVWQPILRRPRLPVPPPGDGAGRPESNRIAPLGAALSVPHALSRMEERRRFELLGLRRNPAVFETAALSQLRHLSG